MKAIMKKGALGLVGFLLVCLISMFLAFNLIVHRGIETFGTKITGTSLDLERVHIALRRGHAEIWGMVIGNPQQFKTPYAVACKRITIDFDPESIFSPSILIREIVIEDPEVMYEGLGSESNINVLKKNIEAVHSDKAVSEKDGDVKKVVIERLLIRSGQIHLSAGFITGPGATIPLPEIEMTGIGKDKQGEPLIYISRVIFSAFSRTIFTAVSSGDRLMKDATDVFSKVLSKGVDAGNGSIETLKRAGRKGTEEAIEGIRTIFGGKR
ncbi:MAG: hypothetical protein JXM72_01005 [Deltaproteobacteria bacterium]|nr:hypothetical protein [Deltaproteobacteria bacterium]